MNIHRETVKIYHPRTNCYALVNKFTFKNDDQSTHAPLALVLAHSTSNHKEQWDPVVIELSKIWRDSRLEIFAPELPNHGRSALLNEEQLAHHVLSLEDHADFLRYFLMSSHLVGKPIIAVGHSSMTAAWTLAIFQKPGIPAPIQAFIFIEPVHILPPITTDDERLRKGEKNIASVRTRRTKFNSMEHARSWMKKHPQYKSWDSRAFEGYMNNCFKPVSADSEAVQTTCTQEQEIPLYEPWPYMLAGQLYTKLCEMFDIHCVFGERPELYPVRERLTFSDTTQGRCPKSSQVIPNSGHLVVQERPAEIAKLLARIARLYVGSQGAVSRL